MHLIGEVSDLATYRSILNMWGLNGGYSRNPFYPLDVKQEEILRRLRRPSVLTRAFLFFGVPRPSPMFGAQRHWHAIVRLLASPNHSTA